MQRIFVFLIFIFSLVAAKAQGYNIQAYTFHQVITNEQENIGEKIYDFVRNANRRNLHKMQLQIKHSLMVVDSLKPYNNETNYYDAAKKLFQFYKEITNKEYADLEKLVENTAIEPTDFMVQKQKIFDAIKQKSAAAYDPFNKAQDEFCAKYGIKVE